MSYTAKFNSPEEAMEYAKDYNKEGWNLIIKEIEAGNIKNRFMLRFLMEFAGIQGYPVECLADKYNLPEKTNT